MLDEGYQTCPKCKTSSYRNPSMKLMVNVCGHNLCESCVELLFVKGSGACPECGLALRRNNFRFQLFEDAAVDRSVDIRRRVLRDYNKKEDDFDSMREYNDYLEMVEDVIFNLTHNVDVAQTNKQISDYREQNRDMILRNRNKMSQEQIMLEDITTAEARQREMRWHLQHESEAQREEHKKSQQEELIRDLIASNVETDDASTIVTRHHNQLLTSKQQQNSSKQHHPQHSLLSETQKCDSIQLLNGKQHTAPMSSSAVPSRTVTSSSQRVAPAEPDEPFVYRRRIFDTCGPDATFFQVATGKQSDNEENITISYEALLSKLSAAVRGNGVTSSDLQLNQTSSRQKSMPTAPRPPSHQLLCCRRTLADGLNSMYYRI